MALITDKETLLHRENLERKNPENFRRPLKVPICNIGSLSSTNLKDHLEKYIDLDVYRRMVFTMLIETLAAIFPFSDMREKAVSEIQRGPTRS